MENKIKYKKELTYGFGTYNGLVDLALIISYKGDTVNVYSSFIMNGKKYKYVINPVIAEFPEDMPYLREICYKHGLNAYNLKNPDNLVKINGGFGSAFVSMYL